MNRIHQIILASMTVALLWLSSATGATTVTTFAGTAGQSGSADGTGSAARFYDPTSVAVDASGNVYVADYYNHTIRKITSAGVVTTLAGTAGVIGFADGTGSAAGFWFPHGVAVDASGNVYVADANNNAIRKITPAGVVTTLAGTGVYGSADGTGSAASFGNPFGVAVDASGNVFVAEYNNHTIRKITSGGVVTTLAGTAGVIGSTDGTGSAARFFHPTSVAVDASGNVYVADYYNRIIRKITSAGVVTTLAGTAGVNGSTDGTGSAALFSTPNGVTVDPSGNVYVGDYTTIRKITSGGVVTTLAGTAGVNGSTDGTECTARFYQPNGVAVDASGNVYVADSANNAIRVCVPTAGTAPTITSPLTASGTVGTPFTYTITACGSTPITFTASPLLAGLSFSGATISGTPTASGTTNVTLTASNGTLPNDSKTLDITIAPSSTTFTAGGRVGMAAGGTAVAGVTVTFSSVSGTGAIPTASVSDALGSWTQNGFAIGTTYRATPSKTDVGKVWTFTPVTLDFSAASLNLDFTAVSLSVSASLTANTQSVTTIVNTPLGITLSGSGASSLSFAIANSPVNGTISSLSATTGACTYTPNNGFTGTDSFTFIVSDGTNASAPGTVNITVQASGGLGNINSPVITSVFIPATGAAGTPIPFSISAQSQTGGPTTVVWDFGDGTTGTGDAPSHTYAKKGYYFVTVFVTDANGFGTKYRTTVSVNGAKPPRPTAPPRDKKPTKRYGISKVNLMAIPGATLTVDATHHYDYNSGFEYVGIEPNGTLITGSDACAYMQFPSNQFENKKVTLVVLYLHVTIPSDKATNIDVKDITSLRAGSPSVGAGSTLTSIAGPTIYNAIKSGNSVSQHSSGISQHEPVKITKRGWIGIGIDPAFVTQKVNFDTITLGLVAVSDPRTKMEFEGQGATSLNNQGKFIPDKTLEPYLLVSYEK